VIGHILLYGFAKIGKDIFYIKTLALRFSVENAVPNEVCEFFHDI
jgi:hypothetical protein